MAEQVAQQFTEFYYKTFGALSPCPCVAEYVKTPIGRAWRGSTSVSEPFCPADSTARPLDDDLGELAVHGQQGDRREALREFVCD